MRSHFYIQEGLDSLWSSVKDKMYSLSNRERQLGLGDKGVTTYFSDNCNKADAEKVNRFFKAKNLEGYINRVLKTEDSSGIK